MQALYIASTGMMAQETNVEVISNNIANMRTAGFKKQRAEFQDLLYQNLRRVGAETSEQGTILPSGVQIGSGVMTAATPRIMSQGSIQPTDKELDMAISGDGFFQIQLPDGGTAYTRAGTFERDATGTLVTADGFTVEPGITIPENARGLAIGVDGTVTAVLGTGGTATTIGQVQLARFINQSGLQAIGDNLFTETASSGAPVTGNPTDEGFGSIRQGYIELANVNSVTEISDLIAAQRAYEMNARVVRAADEMLSNTSQMMR
ncbi:flagellar basal-body rod protein FlgG [Ahrensia marina]|jgi:flagellar basal-body rod protein FlgG|uniref:flagellar basal-body rod protein FlgG n=1 Tax=Ahrensia marina TaxID=1514904 RepID=UPI0035D08624